VKKQKKTALDFVIDKLTNSIENTFTGELFDTEIVRLTLKDIKQIKKADWLVTWLTDRDSLVILLELQN
jgi:hypothetical protein